MGAGRSTGFPVRIACENCSRVNEPIAQDLSEATSLRPILQRSEWSPIEKDPGSRGIVGLHCPGAWTACFCRAGVAQLAERQPSKLNVAGSIPVSRSNPCFAWVGELSGCRGLQ
jgi:hypothetical protein